MQRDGLGIPVITAGSSHDLFYAQGYVHAQDRFWEMDFRRHVTSGRVAELFGESQVATDKFLRTLGWREVAEQEVEALDETVRGYYDAYAEGVNAYLADHEGSAASLEYAVLGLQNPDYEIEPWTPADSVAWLKAMAWDLRGNIETETERALMAPRLHVRADRRAVPGLSRSTATPSSFPRITAIEDAVQPVGWTAGDGCRSRRRDGIGRLAGGRERRRGRLGTRRRRRRRHRLELVGRLGRADRVRDADARERPAPRSRHAERLAPGRPPLRPGERHLPFDVAGFGFSGVPGVVIGHNSQIAWGFTNLTTDVTDLYLEKVEGDQYWRDGALVPLDERTETIEVAGGDPVELTIRSTVHGPIISGLTPDFTAIADDPYTGTDGIVVDARRPAHRRVRGEPAVDRPAAGDDGIRSLRDERRAGLHRLPRGRRALRRAGAEPRVRRRRGQHRLPDARPAADPRRRRRLAAAAGVGFRLRLDRVHPVRGAARRRSTRTRATS